MISNPWVPLSAEGAPPLLVKWFHSDEGYTVSLTDLTHVWSETQDVAQIRRKALADATSIDPSEDLEQMRILLSKIEGTFKGDQDSNITLTYIDEEESLVFKIVARLPEPFEPLRWRMVLKIEPTPVCRQQVTFPLLALLYDQSAQINDLLRIVSDKDDVITKLLDKFENASIDIKSIFPSVAGVQGLKRGAQRSAAARYIKGLGVFEKSKWLKDLPDLSGSALPIDDLVGMVFRDNPALGVLVNFPSGNVNVPTIDWWRSLNGEVETRPDVGVKTKPNESARDEIANDGSDDDFDSRVGAPGPWYLCSSFC